MSDAWTQRAIRAINADYTRSADTHLIRVHLPATPDIHLYLKDESTHPTGSLKHRLARSLYLYALCNGWIREGSPVIEASSGSTAISEAYFARLIGVRFIAVIARTTSLEKIRRIERYGGAIEFVDDPSRDRERAAELARELGGHFMDQFTYAERATDWRGNNNIAESIFAQMADEPHPIPRWIVCGAGTGGTSATFGRYVRYCTFDTRLCVVDPVNSAFYDYFYRGEAGQCRAGGSGIEGIGRPRVEPSFVAGVIDRMLRVAPTDAYAAMRFLSELLGRRCGASTGANLIGAAQIIAEMAAHGERGSVVSLICDAGELYLDTYCNPDWLAANGHDLGPCLDRLQRFYDSGVWLV